MMAANQLRSCVVREGIDALVQVVLKREILGNEHSLPVFLDHVEVISRIYPALEEDAVHNDMTRPSAEAVRWLGTPSAAAHVRIGSELEEFCNQGRRAFESDGLTGGGVLLLGGCHFD